MDTNEKFRSPSFVAHVSRVVVDGHELFTPHWSGSSAGCCVRRGRLQLMGSCIFCDVVSGVAPAEIVHADDRVVAFLDRAPLFKGHVLVVPRCHVETLAALPADLVDPFFGVVQRLARAVPAALDAHGTFVAINNIVSQSVPHLHAHVVPRRRQDGLRGFFWPRVRYADAGDAAAFAAQIRALMATA